jgi:hypothetical protein
MSDHSELLAQLRAELEAAEKAVRFWQMQPEIPVWPNRAFTANVRASRIEALQANVRSIQEAIAVVEEDDAKGG